MSIKTINTRAQHSNPLESDEKLRTKTQRKKRLRFYRTNSIEETGGGDTKYDEIIILTSEIKYKVIK